jgi:branched-chain amino acid transport system substrate-binding protein
LPIVRKGLFLLFLIAGIAAVSCSTSNKKSSGSPVTIGALLPLTGALASYGETSNAALADAVTTLNTAGASKLSLIVEDTKTDPAVALEKLRSLHDRGARLVIGPYSSSEVKAVKEYADKNDIVLISPLSTATSLAISSDNIFRFTPDDELEANAVAALAQADGIRTILPVTRDDEGNRGLQTSMKAAFESAGGSVVPGVTYGANETDFTAAIQTLTGAFGNAKGPSNSIGVYLTGFSEVGSLLTAASKSSQLQALKWYGSDSVAQSKDLLENKTAAAFAIATGYPNPILGVSDSDKAMWQPVSDRIKQKIGRVPDAFALASHDALTVGYRALTKNGSGNNVASLKQTLAATAADYHGLTGATNLNAAGDRASANYDFWSVCSRGGQFVWIRAVSYTSTSGKPGQVSRPETC